MVVVDCPYPDCNFNTGDYADTLAATHFQVHGSGFHSDGTPNGDQNNTTRVTVVLHVKKIKHPIFFAASSDEDWSFLNIRLRE